MKLNKKKNNNQLINKKMIKLSYKLLKIKFSNYHKSNQN